jgi:hypothetical protein
MNKKMLAVMLATLMSATMLAGMTTVTAEEEKIPTIIGEIGTEEEIQKLREEAKYQKETNSLSGPDMQVTDIWLTAYGNRWIIHADVTNTGDTWAEAQYTYFFKEYGTEDQSCLGSFLHGLGFGAGITKYPFTQPKDLDGEISITVIADYWDDEPDELNENNNARTEPFDL